MGWFFGVKLHLVITDCGELLAVRVTPGNVDDRQPVLALVKRLGGKLFGDQGYISKHLRDQLRAHGIELITRIKANMKNQLLLRKRAIIETVIDQLKNISQIEHARHLLFQVFKPEKRLIAELVDKVIAPAEAKVNQLRPKT